MSSAGQKPPMTGAKHRVPYGQWTSPLGAAEVALAAVRKGDVSVARGAVYWTERRPQEQGRTVVVRKCTAAAGDSATQPPTAKQDVVGEERSVRSSAHEYGGACYVVLEQKSDDPAEEESCVVFADDPTKSIVLAEGACEKVLLEDHESAYADFVHDPRHDRILAIQEHTPALRQDGERDGERDGGRDNHLEPIDRIVAINIGQPQDQAEVLIDSRDLGCDFLSSPRLSPDGTTLVFVAWRHPDMPWDSSELWTADVDSDGHCLRPRKIAGGDGVSIFQPEFSPGGQLHFVSDESGWWNIYRFDEALKQQRNLLPMEAEFGLPQWVFGMSTYQIPRDDLVVAVCSRNGVWEAGSFDPRSDRPVWTTLPGVEGRTLTSFDSVACDPDVVALLAAGPHDQSMVLAWQTSTLVLQGCPPPQVLDQQPFASLDGASISVGEPIQFQSPHSAEASLGTTAQTRSCHAFYYPPTSSEWDGALGTTPPLIVKSHGGPTAATDNALDPAIQFWTSRGFAIVDVNYAGSTGYGRAYRELLDGQWGIVDVEDCASAALALAALGLADPERLIIRGGSAGGYTTLAALTFTATFCAGASLYGIGDLETLARDTHKFESRYLDRMIGPYPEQRELYRARSPIHSADQLSCPVIFFQGTEDKVVPPAQSEAMVRVLEAKGVRTKYVLFEGEGHGFRRAENIETALEEELAFYQACFSAT